MQHVSRRVQSNQEGDGLADIGHVHHRLRLDAAICLSAPLSSVSAHGSLCVADVKLGAGDGVLPPVKGRRPRQACDGVF